jgi:cysteine dioxygenase
MSPIHDHAGSSCWVKVLQGELREVRYKVGGATDAPVVTSDVTVPTEGVAYINDTMGVHAMGNPHSDQTTVTLHIYAPPYSVCTGALQAGGSRGGFPSWRPRPTPLEHRYTTFP